MKRWLINGLGIVLALCLALGGLVLMEHLLEGKRERELSASGGLDETGLSLETAGQSGERPILTKEELRQVLLAMQGREVPHEPLEGQLSMEQAMELGKEWVGAFCFDGLEISGFEEQKYQRMDARLCRRQEDGREDSNRLYSYWTVSLTSREFNAQLVMNAVTGQILEAQLAFAKEQDTQVTYAFSDEAIWQLLDRYAASFGMDMDNVVFIDEDRASKSLNDGEFYAVARTGNAAVSVQTDEFKMSESEECLLYVSIMLKP